MGRQAQIRMALEIYWGLLYYFVEEEVKTPVIARNEAIFKLYRSGSSVLLANALVDNSAF